MQHVVLSQDAWSYSPEPFPAYRASLVFGRNKRDSEFIAVNGVTPNDRGELPENGFQVVKTPEGQIVIRAGEDTTPRCLLFVGCEGGYRGGVSLLSDVTTASILVSCTAGNACESKLEVVALMNVGNVLTFWKYDDGRGRFVGTIQYEWNGIEVLRRVYTDKEWKARDLASADLSGSEVL